MRTGGEPAIAYVQTSGYCEWSEATRALGAVIKFLQELQLGPAA